MPAAEVDWHGASAAAADRGTFFAGGGGGSMAALQRQQEKRRAASVSATHESDDTDQGDTQGSMAKQAEDPAFWHQVRPAGTSYSSLSPSSKLTPDPLRPLSLSLIEPLSIFKRSYETTRAILRRCRT
jgi:hypothetical protein